MTESVQFIKLPSDGETQSKGAKDDPDVWTVRQMNDPNTKFKVVDNSDDPINVAHMFNSEASAQQYIDHYRWLRHNPCPEGQSRDLNTGLCLERPTTGTDNFGVKKICETIPNGLEVYYPKDKITKKNTKNIGDDKWERKVGVRHFQSGGSAPTDEWNVWIPKDHVDLEATGYFKISDVKEDDEMDVKIRGPNHQDGNGSWYKIGLEFNGKPYFGKEWVHSGREDNDVDKGENTVNVGNVKNKWVGFKGITYNKDGGVRCQCWVDGPYDNIDNGPPNNWKKTFDVLDTHDPITKANMKNPNIDKILIQFRIDNCGRSEDDDRDSSIDYRHLSVRQIKPNS